MSAMRNDLITNQLRAALFYWCIGNWLLVSWQVSAAQVLHVVQIMHITPHLAELVALPHARVKAAGADGGQHRLAGGVEQHLLIDGARQRHVSRVCSLETQRWSDYLLHWLWCGGVTYTCRQERLTASTPDIRMYICNHSSWCKPLEDFVMYRVKWKGHLQRGPQRSPDNAVRRRPTAWDLPP